jgi:ABC-type bacteriocin/lantibiotic exporter with double-glycine peptidase domain
MNAPARKRKRHIVPEVVQTSAMDCGPASLKSLLEGFGINANYGRLREACQTDVDGTSIDTLEDLANQLGLEAEQIMAPIDHVLLSETQNMPAIAVVLQHSGLTHFVVAWNRCGRRVQVMDPGTGRRWPTWKRFLGELYVHTMPISGKDCREWTGSDDFLVPLLRRLKYLVISESTANGLIDIALSDPNWRSFAALDAATRLTDLLVGSRSLRPGPQARRVLEGFFDHSRHGSDRPFDTIPAKHWTMFPDPATPQESNQLFLRGAVLVRIRGPKAVQSSIFAAGKGPSPEDSLLLSPELVAAIEEPPSRPGRDFLRMLASDGLLAPLFLASALMLSAAGLVFEAVLFRGLLDMGGMLATNEQRVIAMGVLLFFLLSMFLLELPIVSGLWRLGRHLESRLRIAFQKKIPRLGDPYFHSRLTSDMAERCHSVHLLRSLPAVGGRLIRSSFTLALTTVGIAWLDPSGAPTAIIVAILAVALPLFAQPLLTERDLKLRTLGGALTRFYLDALLGLVPVRTHGAENSLRKEHETMLSEWMHAGVKFLRASVTVESLLSFAGFGLAAWLLYSHMDRSGQMGSVMLLVYWALSLPAQGRGVARLARQYPAMRNVILRLFEPLGAPEEADQSRQDGKAGPRETSHQRTEQESQKGVALRIEQASAGATGHIILQEINLTIDSGSQVAIIGPSGAGKSSLVGLFLGWYQATSGRVLVDGNPLEGDRLHALREQTAWVDPAVQLWNRSFLANIRYGSPEDGFRSFSQTLDAAGLREVLEHLPDGLQTVLGEGGGLVSGGQGQRVRLGRGLFRQGARLVILDEPFHGLDRGQRRMLLLHARQWWCHATLLCVTHDVGETEDFDRVIVMDGGRIIEDDPPHALLEKPNSRYRTLMEAEKAIRTSFRTDRRWRRLRMDSGVLKEIKEEDRGRC